MSRAKHSVELKLSVVNEYLSGEGSYKTIAMKYGIVHRVVQDWVRKYRAQSEGAFNLNGTTHPQKDPMFRRNVFLRFVS